MRMLVRGLLLQGEELVLLDDENEYGLTFIVEQYFTQVLLNEWVIC